MKTTYRLQTIFLITAGLLHIAAAPVEIAKQDNANLQRPQWSEDGTQLAYEANYHKTKRIETFVGRFPTGPYTNVSPRARVNSGLTTGFQRSETTSQVVHELCWSPSPLNQYMISASNALGDYDLYFKTSPYAGNHTTADGGCSWSRNGQYVAFTSARTGGGDLYIIDTLALDTAPKRITDTPSAAEVYPTWSSDSKSLVFVTHTHDGDHLWWLPSIQHQPIRLTRGSASQTRPRFSPTGTHVAYYEQKTSVGGLDLCVLEIGAPADPKCIATDVVANTTGPVWSPSGSHILYTRNDDIRFDPIEAVAIRRPHQQTTLPLSTVGHGDLSVHGSAKDAWVVAYIAQGTNTDTQRGFKKLYVATVPIPSP